MSLRTRLRVLIVSLTVTIVIALSILNVSGVVEARLEAVQGRADLTTQEVQSAISEQLTAASAATRSGSRVNFQEEVFRAPRLAQRLLKARSNSPAFLEIVVEDGLGNVLASTPAGARSPRAGQWPDFAMWQQSAVGQRLIEILTQQHEYAFTRVLSMPGSQKPQYVIRIILSTLLLSNLLSPDLTSIAVVSLVSLLITVILAILVSNLALQPVALINNRLDQISPGLPRRDLLPGSDEIAAVENKLMQLGRQYRGAREDAAQLRGNFDQLLRRLEETVLLFDPQGRLVMAGQPAERLLGASHESLLGQSIQEIFPIWTSQGAVVQQALQQHRSLHSEPLLLERSGLPTMRLIVNLEHLEVEPGAPIGIVVTLRDADSRRELESQLDVSSRLAAITRITGGVAHEIRNPLNAITLHLEVLRSKLTEDLPRVSGEIDVIAREMARLDRVVKTFLDFTRPVRYNLRPVDLAKLTNELLTLVQPHAKQRNVNLVHEVKSEARPIHGDWDSLKQALLNVIMNGVEAISESGEVAVRVDQVFDEAVVTVRDTGCGIPPEIQDKVFNLYFTTKENANGIGLAVTFQVVQLHNGAVDFTSETGKGTTFRFRFPIRPGEPDRSKTEAA